MKNVRHFIVAFGVFILIVLTIQSFYVIPNEIKELYNYLKISNTLNNENSEEEITKIKYGELIRVARVIDGDTIELENGEILRYIGIDTPEKNDPRKPVQCFSDKATEKNKELVEGKYVRFYKDVTERDKYKRLLGYVYLEDNTFVNLELVKQGYAFSYSYPPDISKQNIFLEAEKYARGNNLGLWGECEVSTSTSGRLESNPI